MAMGRPTEWSPEVEAAAWEYIENYEQYGHAVPSLVGLCRVINRGKSTIYDWAKDENKNFSDILSAINEYQELVAVNKGITGEYNAAIVKLLLGKHGYHDKVDGTVSGPDGGAIEVKTIERRIIKATDTNGRGI